VYLGDGMVSAGRRDVWRLRITLDARYPGIIARTSDAIASIVGRPAGSTIRPGCLEVSSYWKHWICLFPQHGVGPKHERKISLAPWQVDIVHRAEPAFLAGLIHSDGCRCLNRVKGRLYPRYFFSTLSIDLRTLFVETCSSLGIETRQAGSRNIAVSRRESVVTLDRLVGPTA